MTTPTETDDRASAPVRASGGSFFRDVVPALLWTLMIFVLGGGPAVGPTSVDLPIDKVEHAAAFGILQLLVLRALRYELPSALPRAMTWVAALVSTAAGGALELYQLTVPNRSAELMDLVADAVGAGLAAFLARKLGRH